MPRGLPAPCRRLAPWLVTLALVPLPAWAEPVPVPLWGLIDQAEVVVLAEVERIQPHSRLLGLVVRKLDLDVDIDIDRDSAHLRVLQVWKGRAPRRIRVKFMSDPGCCLIMQPPHYVAGETVLAFLQNDRWSDSGDAFETVFYRYYGTYYYYGTFYPTPDGVPVFRRLVDRALRLQAAGSVSPEDRVDWVVEAAAHATSRWQGLFPLARKGDGGGRAVPLTREQLQRIADGFVAEPTADYNSYLTLGVLHGFADPRVDELAVRIVEAWLREEEVPSWLSDLMILVLNRHGDPEPVLGSDDDPERLRDVWREARERLRIPVTSPSPSEVAVLDEWRAYDLPSPRPSTWSRIQGLAQRVEAWWRDW